MDKEKGAHAPYPAWLGCFGQNSQSRLLAVKEHLSKCAYQPKPVKRVWIEKPGSVEKRPLGIPTVAGRVVQAAVRMVMEPIFENRFAKHSYGFRPGRGCKDALRRVEELLKAGRRHVVEVDIKGCFDAIPRDRLMALVRERIADGKVLGLIEGFLKQGVMEDVESAEAMEETPEDKLQDESQGGVISPLLANIYLDPLDWLMAGLGFEMVRYADDMVVLCHTMEEAGSELEKLREWMAGAGLTLHPDKTRTVDMTVADSHFDFLGYRFKRSRKGKMMRLVRPKKPAQAARNNQTPDAPEQWQEHGSHRDGHQPNIARLVWLVQKHQSQRTGRHRRMDTHEIALHPKEAARPGRLWRWKGSPTLAQQLLQEARVLLPAGCPGN